MGSRLYPLIFMSSSRGRGKAEVEPDQAIFQKRPLRRNRRGLRCGGGMRSSARQEHRHAVDEKMRKCSTKPAFRIVANSGRRGPPAERELAGIRGNCRKMRDENWRELRCAQLRKRLLLAATYRFLVPQQGFGSSNELEPRTVPRRSAIGNVNYSTGNSYRNMNCQ